MVSPVKLSDHPALIGRAPDRSELEIKTLRRELRKPLPLGSLPGNIRLLGIG